MESTYFDPSDTEYSTKINNLQPINKYYKYNILCIDNTENLRTVLHKNKGL